MSNLAKFLIVVQAVLVFMFLGVSSSLFQHRRDWRTSYAKLKERYGKLARASASKIDKAEAIVAEKQKFADGKSIEISSLETQLSSAKEDRKDVSGRYSSAQDEAGELRRQQASASAIYDNRQNEVKSLNSEIDQLKRELEENVTRRGNAEAQVARLQTINNGLEGDMRDLAMEYSNVRNRLREKSLLIAMAQEKGLDFSTLLAGAPPKLIKSRVAAVKNDMNPALVVIGVGSDDSVEIGYTFSVIRGNQFVAKLIVESVKPSYSACRIKFAAEGQNVEPGDIVTTRLP